MTIKMRAKIGRDATEIVARIEHPMETGLRVDRKSKQKIPAHFIQKATFFQNGVAVVVADLGPAVARDPVLRVRLQTKPNDVVRLTWSDNKGETGSAELVIAENTSSAAPAGKTR